MKRNGMLLLVIMALAACGGGNDNAAGKVVEKYLQAKVDGDGDILKTVLCAANEGDANREAASFAALDATLESVACTFEDASSTVSCTGKIVAVYNGENREIELPNYSVVQEDGLWKVCGEAG